MAPVRMYIFTQSQHPPLRSHAVQHFFEILATAFSLCPHHTYVFTYCTLSTYLQAFFPTPVPPPIFFLTIAHKVSLQNTNVLLSPWKQCRQRGRTGTVRESSQRWHSYQNHSSLVHMCMEHVFVCLFVFFSKSLVPVPPPPLAALLRVGASGSFSSLPSSSLLFLALLTGAASSITAEALTTWKHVVN